MRNKPQVTFQAPDESGSAAAADESKRKKVSTRAYINADKSEADTIESAAGAQYMLLDPAGNHTFDELFDNPKFTLMCAIFGFHTKIGNVANTVLNDKDEPGTPADAAAAINEFITAAKGGVWAERSQVVGVRVDKDKLAGAILAVATADGKTTTKDGKPLDYQYIRDRLENEPAYVRAAKQVPSVAQAYATAVGKAAKSVDDLLG